MAVTEAFFLPANTGTRFCVAFRPEGPIRGGVVLVPPFAEEANKTRSNLAHIARAFANKGILALIGDVYGTGDSSGDFADAGWDCWLEDLALFVDWVRSQGCESVSLLGLRLGALLAADALNSGVKANALLCLAPVASGKQALTQFLRLGAAAELADSPDARIDTRRFRAQLAKGEHVEIAGYSLSSRLAFAIEQKDLAVPGSPNVPLVWVEVSNRGELTPVAIRLMEVHAENGGVVRSHIVAGPAFWQTQEIEHLPSLAQVCVDLLSDLPDSAMRAAAHV